MDKSSAFPQDETKLVINRNCGYFGKTFKCNQEDFLKHVNICELDKVNKHYGDLSGGPTK